MSCTTFEGQLLPTLQQVVGLDFLTTPTRAVGGGGRTPGQVPVPNRQDRQGDHVDTGKLPPHSTGTVRRSWNHAPAARGQGKTRGET